MPRKISEIAIKNKSIKDGVLMISCIITLNDGTKINYKTHNEIDYITNLCGIGGTVSQELEVALGGDYLDVVADALCVAAEEMWGGVEEMLSDNSQSDKLMEAMKNE